jgi:hypothetical protein
MLHSGVDGVLSGDMMIITLNDQLVLVVMAVLDMVVFGRIRGSNGSLPTR